MTKKVLREKVLQDMKAQGDNEGGAKSRIIKNKLFALPAFRRAQVIMFYLAKKEEVQTQEMIDESLQMGKTVTVPVIEGEELSMVLYTKQIQLEQGPYDIMQPVREQWIRVPADRVDLVTVPAIAFDRSGNRLGRGKGYYDRFLKRVDPHACTVGVCYDFQLLDRIPVSSHDIPVTTVLSN